MTEHEKNYAVETLEAGIKHIDAEIRDKTEMISEYADRCEGMTGRIAILKRHREQLSDALQETISRGVKRK